MKVHWVYHWGRIFTRSVLFLFTRCRVNGLENVPADGPLLVVANHLSLADPPLLGTVIKHRTMFMAKEELFRSGFSRFFVQNFGAFPVRRGGSGRQALREAEQYLKQGLAVIMFPEGGRSLERQLKQALPGAALLACRSHAPILPVGISGTEHIHGLGWLLRRPRITVNIGQPLPPTAPSAKTTKEELAQLTASMMKDIAGLLPPEYRGSYAV